MAQQAGLSQKEAEKTGFRGMKLVSPAIILLTAAIAVWPLLVKGPTCGGDFYFHFVSWSEARRSMLQGILYPHWANSPNFGFGEPRFVFYPPLTWMMGALMGLFLSGKGVALVLDFLLLAATGLANRALAREVLEDGPATLAGCASIYLGRSISDISQRSDFAELTGGFWIPLLLLFLLRNRNPSGRFRERVFDGSAVPLALVVAGAWLSNGPLGIEVSYLLAAVALVSAALQKSWAPVARATVGVALGMGLASIYLIPAVWERNWANIQYAITKSNYLIENSWLFGRHADPALSEHDSTLFSVSVVAVLMFAVTLISMIVAWRRGKLPGDYRWWVPLSLIPFAVFFLQLPVSHPVWNWLPELRFLQFPWRWLLVMEPPLAVFFASAVWIVPLRGRIMILGACAVCFFLISIAAWAFFYHDCQVFDARVKGWEEAGGAYGFAEYSPPGVQYRFVMPDVPGNCVASDLNDLRDISGNAGDGYSPVRPGSESLCQGTFTEAPNMAEYKKFTGVADHAGYLILRLRSYPAWAATLNGNPAPTLTERGHGLMAVAVTQGPVVVTVKWRTTPDVIIGRWLSALALTLLTALYLLERKLFRLVHPDGNASRGEVSVDVQTGSNAPEPSASRSLCRCSNRVERAGTLARLQETEKGPETPNQRPGGRISTDKEETQPTRNQARSP